MFSADNAGGADGLVSVCCNPAHDCFLGMAADVAFDFLAILEDDQAGYRMNCKFARGLFADFHVDFGDLGVSLTRQSIEDWKHHLAGPAPGCIEIHDRDAMAVADFGIECAIIQRHRADGLLNVRNGWSRRSATAGSGSLLTSRDK